jgi:hypothetical protein
MKRWHLLLTMAGVLLLIGWGIYGHSRFCPLKDATRSSPLRHVNRADAMDSLSGWRYRQNQPHHWRYIMLQK